MSAWRQYLDGTHARIDLDRYASNIKRLQALAPTAGLMAVVKADAYGHGAVNCARAAVEAGCTWLGVARVNEALLLRREGVVAPLLVLGPPNPAQIADSLEHDITLAIGSFPILDVVTKVASTLGLRANIHVKVDTGMHRYGFAPDEVAEVVEGLTRVDAVNVEGIFTHFARADEEDLDPTDAQVETFAGVVNQLRARGCCPRWVHQANSAGILTGRISGTNLVRGGIATYGLSPSDELVVDTTFQPILSLHSAVGRRFILAPGEGVTYGWTYTATSIEEVADVPVGYADGLPRNLANAGWFVVDGQRAPIRGRVCMDQTVVAVPHSVKVGDPVVVYGGDAAMSLEEVGSASGTNNYEVATRLTARVPRLYFRSGVPCAWEHVLLGERGFCDVGE